ncbi:MAG: hypothetical protein GW938_05355 [Leptospira sp.]|nr:hypothetical protein [Leptospira sp.]NCS93895.1 hypothetical protein [Leptospira sp.]
MKKYIFIVIFLSIIFPKFALQKANDKSKFCRNYRSGILENTCISGHRSIITRYGSYQIQKYKNFYLKENVKWIDECTYMNTLIETNDPANSDYIGAHNIVIMIHVKSDQYQTNENNSLSCVIKKIGEIPSTEKN